jgi:hypothetical protein
MKSFQGLPAPQEVGTSATLENHQWVADHAADIAHYNEWADKREPYAQRVRRWRQTQAGCKSQANAAV